MISAAVNSLVMLPMWKASSTPVGRTPMTDSPLATKSTGPSPCDEPSTVPGTVNVIGPVWNEVGQVLIGAAIALANALPSEVPEVVVELDEEVVELDEEVEELDVVAAAPQPTRTMTIVVAAVSVLTVRVQCSFIRSSRPTFAQLLSLLPTAPPEPPLTLRAVARADCRVMAGGGTRAATRMRAFSCRELRGPARIQHRVARSSRDTSRSRRLARRQ